MVQYGCFNLLISVYEVLKFNITHLVIASNLGPSYFSYPAVQQPLAASGLLVEPPLGVTPSPIMAAMAASVGGLLRLPPHAPPLLSSTSNGTSNNNNSNAAGRKEVTFEEESV